MAPQTPEGSQPAPGLSQAGDRPAQGQPDAPAPLGSSDPQRRVLGALIALAVVLVAGAVGLMVLLTESTPSSDSPEAGFARDMQIHHAQAVEMALVVREKSQDPALRSLAYDIATSQQQQQGQMYAWLEMWALPKVAGSEPMAWMNGMDHTKMSGSASMRMGLMPDGRMPGMASEADLARLGKLGGKDAEILFLELMIAHHEAGVMMAEAALQMTEEPVVRRLASAIRTAQASEIKTMRDMLADRGIDPDKRSG